MVRTAKTAAHPRLILLVLFVLLLFGWTAGVLWNFGQPGIHLLLIAAVGSLIVAIADHRHHRGDV